MKPDEDIYNVSTKFKGKQYDMFLVEPECPIAREVMTIVSQRAAEGMKTYGKTMDRTDIDTVGWIDHTIEELLDATAYLVRLKRDLSPRQITSPSPSQDC